VDGTAFSKFLYKTSKKREIGHAWNLKTNGRQTFRFRKFSSWPFQRMERRGNSKGEITKAMAKGICDKEVAVDRRKPGALHQENGRRTEKAFQSLPLHHKPRVPGTWGQDNIIKDPEHWYEFMVHCLTQSHTSILSLPW
jgi:hypothetical protein